MDESPHVVEGPYVRDVLDQPHALEQTLRRTTWSMEVDDVAARVAVGRFRRIVLTGMGSSYHGLHPLRLRLVQAGASAFLVESSELLHYQSRLLEGDTLLVLASQSGRSAEIVRLLERVPGSLTTLGVTNTADSPLAREATAALVTHAGEEATVSCKTHLAAQMILASLGTRFTGGDPEDDRALFETAIAGVGTYLESWRHHVAELATLLRGVGAVYYAGRGPCLGAAGTAGLITKEATHLPSEGLSSAAFRHGPMEMLDESVAVFVFAGEPETRDLNESLAADIRTAGGRALVVADDAEVTALRIPSVPSTARSIVELLPVQMATLALAALDGREAGTFRVGGKVTTTE